MSSIHINSAQIQDEILIFEESANRLREREEEIAVISSPNFPVR